ncbi:hypothetical protein [Tsuneonella amylolytica]|uniref:hypothetical protein n=1 Tax=Tsuneonella amylolytica TaxID=2338327 RepID=UPI000EA87284|nr:hypothetical protein [Tsuneonella amylolytica]
MRRLFLFVMMLAFGMTQVAAAPLSVCRHADAKAHEAALTSSDDIVSASAQAEEAAASVAEKKGHAADGSVNLGNMLLPDLPVIAAVGIEDRAQPAPADGAVLTGRTISPLLNPPLI